MKEERRKKKEQFRVCVMPSRSQNHLGGRALLRDPALQCCLLERQIGVRREWVIRVTFQHLDDAVARISLDHIAILSNLQREGSLLDLGLQQIALGEPA